MIDGRFQVKDGAVSFVVGNYDKRRSLVIDPVLVYSQLLGAASGQTNANAIATDLAGNIYVAGSTSSIDFPVSGSAAQPSYQGNSEAFVAKFTSGGTLVYSTYLGGEQYDSANGIAVDDSGFAYVTGQTSSTLFPHVNASQSAMAGNTDAFLTKLSAVGNSIVYSTYFGGFNSDSANAVTVIKSTGVAYITGYTYSTDLPVLSPYQAANAGYVDMFIAAYSSTGAKQFATYFGGSEYDEGAALAVDSAGNCFITGNTYSQYNFPTTVGVLRRTDTYGEAFVVKFNSSGSGPIYSTLIGGNSADIGRGIAVHSSGAAYVTGYTYSTDLPTTAGVLQPGNAGGGDAFVAKLNIDGTAYQFLTYIGGRYYDSAAAIAVEEPSGNVYVTGQTQSTDFPTSNAVQPVKQGTSDSVSRSVDGGSTWVGSDAGLNSSYTNLVYYLDSANVLVVSNGSTYYSSDGGLHWNPSSNGTYPYLVTNAPSAPCTLYERNSTTGIYKSTDCGHTWGFQGSVPATSVTALTVHATNSQTLYAATPAGVYVSTTAGVTWGFLSASLAGLNISTMLTDSSNSLVFYALTSSYVIYKSADGGSSWSPLGLVSVYSLALSNSVLYAGTGSGLYTSSSGGSSWTARGAGCNYYYYNAKIAPAPSDPDVVYFLQSGTVYRSLDGGSTCLAAPGVASGTAVSLSVNPASATTLMIGSTSLSNVAFVLKLSAGGGSLAYATYLGGSSTDSGAAIATDSGGNAYIAGTASSRDFPVTTGGGNWGNAYQAGFLAKVSDATPACSYSVNVAGVLLAGASASSFPSYSSSSNVVVSAPTGCTWSATSYSPWITIDDQSLHTGVGTVALNIASNSGSPRVGTIWVAGQFVAVNQTGGYCYAYLSTSAVNAVSTGSATTVGVTVPSGCSWQLGTNSPWVTFGGSTGGTGNGTFILTVAPNSNPNSRTTMVMVGNNSLSVSQAGTCSYAAIAPLSFPATGGSSISTVSTSGAACSWSPSISYGSSWITVSPNSWAQGNGSLTITAPANPSSSGRTGYVDIYDGVVVERIRVDQAGYGIGITVNNIGFELGLSNWNLFGSTVTSTTSAAARTGTSGLSENVGVGGVYQDVSGLVRGQFYRLRVYAYVPPGSTAQALVMVHDTTGANVATDGARTPSAGSWQEFAVNFLATSTGQMRIHLMRQGGSGALYWDDVQLQLGWQNGFETGSMSPWQPFGSTAHTVMAAIANTGTYSLAQSGGAGGGVFYDLSGLVSGQVYRVSARARSASLGNSVMLWVHDTTGANSGSMASGSLPVHFGRNFQ